jgi:biotin-independent malonate decarboxylase gamma subunit
VTPSRGSVWSRALFADATAVSGLPVSVIALDGSFAGIAWRSVAVVPDAEARFPRARGGEFGLDEGLAVADVVRGAPAGAAILAVVDSPGQPYGRREESAGLHVALGCAVEAYVTERRRGRQIFALAVGKAISGAFLAHGLQAGWLAALRDPGVEVHVMPASSVARITRESPAEVARVATVVPATARDIETFARSGAVDRLFDVVDPLLPSEHELGLVRAALVEAHAARLGLRAPRERLTHSLAAQPRAAALATRARIAATWDA